MPKKFDTNTKSAEARARQEAVKQAKESEKQQRLADEYWRDDDKHVLRKQNRKVSSLIYPTVRNQSLNLVFRFSG